MIAVEDKARKRLEELSALHKVKPVDLATLTPSGSGSRRGKNNGIVHTKPVYESAEFAKYSSRTLADASSAEAGSNPDLLLNSSGDSLIDLCQDRASENVSQDTTQESFELQEVVTSGGPSTSNQGDAQQGAAAADVNGDDSNNMRTMNGYLEGYNPSNGPVQTEAWNVAPAGYGNEPTPHDLSEDVGSVEPSPNNNKDQSSGHREMAIDCPSNFVGSKKEPPRYPPPNSNSPYRTPGGTPAKKSAAYPDTKIPEPAPYMPAPKMTEEEEQQNFERIKKYQEDLRKRREEESRLEREQEFLRTSLRGSKKLQELEERNAAERSVVL